MPIRGYIIEKYNAMTNAYTCYRLVQEASALDMYLQIVVIHDTVVSPHGVINHGKILEPVDFVINRYKWGREKDAINALATRSYNPLTAYNIYINKFEQVRRLHSKAFLIPKYLLGTSRLPFSSIVEQLGLPFVGKGLESSMGEEIVCIRDKASYEELSLNYPSSKEWLFEEFISESYGRDLRFYSIRGEAVACMQRTSQGDFRANVALGASVEPFPVTSGIRTIAADIYEQTGLDLADCLPAGQKAYVAAPMRWCGVMLALKDRLPGLHPYCARVICSSYLPDWRPGVDYRTVYSAHKAMGGGVTIDLIHEWDYLVELFGVPEKLYNFKGTYSDLEIDSDDLSVYIARYPTLLAEVHLDYFGRGYRRSIELFCHDGSYLADFGAGTLPLPDGTVQHYEEDVNRRYEREMEYYVDYALTGSGESCNPPALALNVLKLTLGENVQ